MISMDRYSKALIEVAASQERERIIELLELKLAGVSDGIFDAKGVLRNIIADLIEGENK